MCESVRSKTFSAKIQRKWIEDINKKLRALQSKTFTTELETNVSTFYTVPEPASKISETLHYTK